MTYFVTGLLAFTLLDYAGRFGDPTVASFMRQAGDPWVASGPMFQVVRGILLGAVFYPLREIVFARRHGWLHLWAVLVAVGSAVVLVFRWRQLPFLVPLFPAP